MESPKKNRGAGVETSEVEACKLAFYAVPKTASTSIKRMLYHVKTGSEFQERDENGKRQTVHARLCPTRYFMQINHKRYRDYTRFCLLRDPVQRIISAYGQRVVDSKELSRDAINPEAAKALGVNHDPGIDEFMIKLPEYRVLSGPVRHHTNPFTHFLGSDLAYFTHVYKTEDLPELVEMVAQKSGFDAKMPHKNKTKSKKRSFDDLSKRAKRSLLRFCAGDYALLKGYYSDEQHQI